MQNIADYVPAPPPKWMTFMARTGLFANGVVYCLVGFLAFMAAFEMNGSAKGQADKQGVLQFVSDQPFGRFMLGLIAVGLLFYAVWRFVQALKDSEQKGSGAKGIGRRLGYLFSGIVYGGLAIAAFKLATGAGSNSSNPDQRESLARTVLEQPFGEWLLGIIGLGVIGSGIYQLYYGLSDKYRKSTAAAGLKHETEAMLIRAGKVGYVARGIVWGLIGYFFVLAAMHHNPKAAGGTG